MCNIRPLLWHDAVFLLFAFFLFNDFVHWTYVREPHPLSEGKHRTLLCPIGQFCAINRNCNCDQQKLLKWGRYRPSIGLPGRTHPRYKCRQADLNSWGYRVFGNIGLRNSPGGGGGGRVSNVSSRTDIGVYRTFLDNTKCKHTVQGWHAKWQYACLLVCLLRFAQRSFFFKGSQ